LSHHVPAEQRQEDEENQQEHSKRLDACIPIPSPTIALVRFWVLDDDNAVELRVSDRVFEELRKGAFAYEDLQDGATDRQIQRQRSRQDVLDC